MGIYDILFFLGKVKTDGVFKKIEKLYKITVIPENNENHTNTEIVETRVTDLYNPQNEMYQKLKRNVHFLSGD